MHWVLFPGLGLQRLGDKVINLNWFGMMSLIILKPRFVGLAWIKPMTMHTQMVITNLKNKKKIKIKNKKNKKKGRKAAYKCIEVSISPVSQSCTVKWKFWLAIKLGRQNGRLLHWPKSSCLSRKLNFGSFWCGQSFECQVWLSSGLPVYFTFSLLYMVVKLAYTRKAIYWDSFISNLMNEPFHYHVSLFK